MINEIKKQISETRKKLDAILETDTDRSKALEVSRELDELISRYIKLQTN